MLTITSAKLVAVRRVALARRLSLLNSRARGLARLRSGSDRAIGEPMKPNRIDG
jgi:hypothetical protein